MELQLYKFLMSVIYLLNESMVDSDKVKYSEVNSLRNTACLNASAVNYCWTKQAKSLLQCGTKCFNQFECLGFFFNAQRKECTGLRRLFSLDDNCANDAASKHLVDSGLQNIALGKPTSQSSYYTHLGRDLDSPLAVDGNRHNVLDEIFSCTHTTGESNPWWRVDFGSLQQVRLVVIYNRNGSGDRLSNLIVYVGDAECTRYEGPASDGEVLHLPCQPVRQGEFLKIQKTDSDILTLCEVEVF